MTFEQIITDTDVSIIVNNCIIFRYDYSDDYIVFREALAIKGIEAFAELLSQDPNTAYSTFCNG